MMVLGWTPSIFANSAGRTYSCSILSFLIRRLGRGCGHCPSHLRTCRSPLCILGSTESAQPSLPDLSWPDRVAASRLMFHRMPEWRRWIRPLPIAHSTRSFSLICRTRAVLLLPIPTMSDASSNDKAPPSFFFLPFVAVAAFSAITAF
jgi:hypothetical protein